MVSKGEIHDRNLSTIDLTPRGMQTPDGVARVNEAIERFSMANLLTDALGGNPDAIRSAICSLGCDQDDADDIISAIKARRAAQEKFLCAVAGR